MHGYDTKELLGKSLSVFHTLDQMPPVNAAIREIRETGVFRGEIWHTRKDGTVFPSKMHNSLLRDETGTPIGMIGIMRDITDQKLAEEALRESEERFRKLSNAAEEGIVIHDHGIIVDVNDATARVFGYETSEMIGMYVKDLATPETWETIKRHIATGYDKPYEADGVKKDGTIFHGQIVGKPFTYRGKTLRVVALRDITNLKKAELEIQKERDRAQKYLDIAGTIMVSIDSKQKISMINAKGCEILERTEEELIGKNWFDTCIPKRMRKSVKAVFKNLISGDIEPVEYYENPVVTKNGKELIIAWYNTVLREDTGRIIGTLSSGAEITERKKSEDMLRKATKALKDERKALTEKNIALQQFLNHIESEKHDYQLKLYRDVEKAIIPFIEKLKKYISPTRSGELEVLESSLNAILTKDLDEFKSRYGRLSSRESQICNLIKQGLSTKQISDNLNLSTLTVHKHREQIRKKLDLTNKKISLATYLRSHEHNPNT
jgi:PAS domain S-box-containing protein